MNPLEALLRPAAKRLDATLAEVTPARELAKELAGTVAAVRVRDTALALWFHIAEDRISLSTMPSEADPDIAIEGSLLALAKLVTGAEARAGGEAGISFTGDAHKARAFQRLLGYAKPDLEEELAGVVGDPAAHALGDFVRGFGRWARDARATLESNLAEYLQEERRDLPTRFEADRFARQVGTLRDDVDRLAARINRLGPADKA